MFKNPDNTWTADALEADDVKSIKHRVTNEPDYIEERDFVDSTPLLNAINYNKLELVRFLLEHGADPNCEVDDGYTCLLSAIESDEKNAAAIAEALIRAKADIHADGINGWTPLHLAAARGKIDIARLLIDAGADVNRRKEIDAEETPLMEAAFMGQASMVRLLLEHGADPTMRETMTDHTALEITQNVMKGPDQETIDILRDEIDPIDPDEMFEDMDLPDEELEMMRQSLKDVDMAQSYIDSTNEILRNGNHKEVIRLLEAHQKAG